MGKEKQLKTFLSYSRANKDFAIKLAKELKSEGFYIWLDQLDIPAGARWDREVEKALEECEIFMIILTQASINSENVLDEIGYAVDSGKRFLPVMLETCNVPLRLRRFQYVDFTTKSFDEGVESAKELLRNLIAQTTIPRMEVPVDAQDQSAQAEREAKAEADRKAKEEAERITKRVADGELAAKAKVETDRKAKEEADRLAVQKTDAEQLARQQAEEERKAKEKAEAERKTKEERERLAVQMEVARKSEKDRLTQARIQAMRAAADEKQKLGGQAPIKPSPTPQKKSSMSPVMLIGIGFGVLVIIIGLCVIGVPSILGLFAPQPTTIPTEIRVTNPVLPITPDTDIPAPIIMTDTDTPTPTYAFKPTSTKEIPTPTFTPVPVIVADPADFIHYYFDNINGRNFDLTWSLLSDAYKAKTNPDGINQYKDFWDDYTVDIVKVDYTRPSATSVLATLRTTFLKNNSSSSNNILSYYLIWDSGRGTWLFDPMPVFGSSTDTTCSTVPKQLSIGIQAKVVTATSNLMLRETPAEGSAVVEKMPPNTIVKVFDGPICGPYRSVYFWWWKVQAESGNIGWVVEGSEIDDRIFIRPAQ